MPFLRARLKLLLAISFAGLISQFAIYAQSPLSPRDELLKIAETERAFAAKSVAENMRAAFLEYFAPDGINFSPHPANTRETLSARPAPTTKPPITLDWWPVFGDISLAGDLGYLTGPFQLTDSRQDNKVVGHGFYFSIWTRQPNGDWLVAVDYGIETPTPGVSKAKAKFQASHWVGTKAGAGMATARNSVLAREKAFGADVARNGPLAAYRSFTSWDGETRIYRDHHQPAIGRAAVTTLFKSPEKITWEALAAGVAKSDDLAYTYGKWQSAENTKHNGYYVRVWRRIRGDWCIVAEVMNPLPSE